MARIAELIDTRKLFNKYCYCPGGRSLGGFVAASSISLGVIRNLVLTATASLAEAIRTAAVMRALVWHIKNHEKIAINKGLVHGFFTTIQGSC